MKKTVIVLCIILAVGFILAVVGTCICLSAQEKEIKSYKKTEQTIRADGLNALTVDSRFEDITIAKTDGEDFTFTYYEGKRLKHTVDNSTEGELTLYTARQEWFLVFWLNRYAQYNTIIIGVPQNYTGALILKTDTGRIKADELKNLSGVETYVKTGDTKLSGITAQTLKVNSVTGNVTIENCEFSSGVTVKSSTGNVSVNGAKAEEVTVKLTTGKVSVNADCKTLSLTATTGDINFSTVTACDVFVKATTGSISGTIRGAEEDYDIRCDTTTGDCNLTDRIKEGGKKLVASATTGDIKIKFI